MRTLEIQKNSRQMPKQSAITKEKDYCDLLYAWLQCNSERESIVSSQRRIEKKSVKWVAIERDFTRTSTDGEVEKVMTRKTIAKYFNHLVDVGLVYEENEYYYLTVLDQDSGHLIEYTTLMKLMNVLQKNSISIYIYLFNRYCANGYEPFIATLKQIKDYIGIATSTTSNNMIIDDTLDILKRLGLLDYRLIRKDDKTYLEFIKVKNQLP